MEEYIADLQEQLITAQHRFMKMHRDLCFTGLRKSEFVMLEIIERENGNREQGVLASDIAKRLRITAPAVSKMLRSMEEKGYDKATGKMLVCVNPQWFRPTDVVNLWGDPTKAKTKLGWNPQKTSYEELCRIMAQHDLELAKREAKLKAE